MIEIDAENKKIFFYYSPEEMKKNSKLDDTMYEFELLSGHVCPECNKVIDAYYVGMLPVRESSSNGWSSHPYVPNPNGGYNKYHPHYKYGHKHGGGYLIMCNHEDTCKVHTIKEEVNTEKKIPGIVHINDACNKRSPIIAINKKTFSGGIEVNGLSEFDKEWKWKELLAKIVEGDQSVTIKSEGITSE